MEKFANKEEQSKWFINAHKRDDVKLLDEVNILLNRDCGDFKLFLRDKILPDSELAYRTFMGAYGSKIGSNVYVPTSMFSTVLSKYFKYLGGNYHEGDSLYNFELTTATRNALLRFGFKTKTGVVSYIEDNGKTSDCLWKKICGIGKIESVKICKALGIEEYIPNNSSSISDIKRYNNIKKYLENGGTDIDEIRRLMGLNYECSTRANYTSF